MFNPGNLGRALLGLGAAGALLAQSTMPVAIVSDVRGSVRLGPGQTVTRLQELDSGQKLEMEKGATLVLLHLQTGEEWSFAGPGKFILGTGLPKGLAPRSQRKVQALQGPIQLKPGAFAQASITLRATPGDAPSLGLRPLGACLLDSEPTFQWKDAGPGASYRFSLKDGQGQPLLDLELDTPALKLPRHLALQEGVTYTWSLRAQDAAGLVTEQKAEGRLLPREQREALLAARPKPGAPFQDRVLYAALLQAAGVQDEARAQWVELAAECPDDKALQRMAGK